VTLTLTPVAKCCGIVNSNAASPCSFSKPLGNANTPVTALPTAVPLSPEKKSSQSSP
tara:strand:- start:132284 stop:132454 length:171 start_codon:yes stop_codon:yes gene_type:complete